MLAPGSTWALLVGCEFLSGEHRISHTSFLTYSSAHLSVPVEKRTVFRCLFIKLLHSSPVLKLTKLTNWDRVDEQLGQRDSSSSCKVSGLQGPVL